MDERIPSHKTAAAADKCIYFSSGTECGILSIGKCKGEKCSFRLTEQEYEAAQKQWKDRMNRMDPEKQIEISRKYYGGKKQW